MRFVVIFATLPLVGCAAAPGPVDAWVDRQGGLSAGAELQQRVDAIARRVSSDVRVAVLNSADLAAYGWPDGRVFVTRGLVAAASDDELAAAIAHELGHLLADGHVDPPAALKGRAARSAHEAEANADRIACELLTAGGADPGAMRRLLTKLAAATPGASTRLQATLRQRISYLEEVERAAH